MLKIIFLTILFIVIFFLLSIVRLFFKLFSKSSFSNSSKNGANQSSFYGSENQNRKSHSDPNSQKVFGKDEGEYVDFVEIEEDELK